MTLLPTAPEADLDELLVRLLGPGATFREGQREAIEAVVDRRAGCSSCSGPGGARAPSTSSRPALLRDRGAGPDAARLARCSRSCATRSRPADRARRARRDDQLRATVERVGRRRGRARSGRGRRAAGLARAARQRALPRGRAARRCVAASGCSWSTRRTASATGATTSGPTTGASPAPRRAARADVPVLATTATANDRVVADIVEQLGDGAARSSAGRSTATASARRSIAAARPAPSGWPGSPSSSRRCPAPASSTASPSPTRAGRRAGCASQGIDARAYSRASSDRRARPARGRLLRERGQGAGRHRRRSAWASTSPTSPSSSTSSGRARSIAYYQQVGRAGRALDDAYGVLLSGREDDEIQDYFIDSAFPPDIDMEAVTGALDATAAMSIYQARGRAQPPAVADPEGAHAARDRRRHRARRRPLPTNGSRYVPDRERMDRITELRRAEKREMRAYLHHRGLPHGVPDSRARRPRPEAVRPLRTRARRPAADDGRPRARPGGDQRCCEGPSRSSSRVGSGRRAPLRISRGASRIPTRKVEPSASRATPAGAGK